MYDLKINFTKKFNKFSNIHGDSLQACEYFKDTTTSYIRKKHNWWNPEYIFVGWCLETGQIIQE